MNDGKTEREELTDDELDDVSGGTVPSSTSTSGAGLSSSSIAGLGSQDEDALADAAGAIRGNNAKKKAVRDLKGDVRDAISGG